jgi:hypothetical protein
VLGDYSSVMNIWSLLFSPKIEDEIIMRSNENLARMREKYKKDSRPKVRDLDRTEFRAYLGLLICSGAFKSGTEELSSMLATDGTDRDLFTLYNVIKAIFEFTCMPKI